MSYFITFEINNCLFQEGSICPSRNESIPLIRDMIKQVREITEGIEVKDQIQMRKFHPHSTRIHIGADEAYRIGLP